MDKNLRNYLKVYDNFLDQDFCKKTVDSLSSATWDEHTFYNASTGLHESFDKELSVSHFESGFKEEINKKIWFAIQKYINDIETNEWFSGWNGYTSIRFNKYDSDTQMKIHCDHIYSMFDGERKGVPILTVLGVLNNDYEGGDFIVWEDTKIDLPMGSLAIFPSNFLYPHEVKLVTKGVRHSYVSWVW